MEAVPCPNCRGTNVHPRASMSRAHTFKCLDCAKIFGAADTNQEAAPVDLINHPPHYTSHPSGVECIQIVEHLNFNIGNAIKYLWRAGLKSPDTISDLKKAAWYVNREIERISTDTKLDPLRRVYGAVGTPGDNDVDTETTPR